jgi:hypothetical protein
MSVDSILNDYEADGLNLLLLLVDTMCNNQKHLINHATSSIEEGCLRANELKELEEDLTKLQGELHKWMEDSEEDGDG